MRGICPHCEKESDLQRLRATETVAVRGTSIEVDVEYLKCDTCGTEFENTRDSSSLAQAYQEFRRLNRMLQPEEIRVWRKNLGLTQRELSDLLGWGAVTLSRYENGALQDEAHEKTLRLAMDPHNLSALIAATPDALTREKHDRLMARLEVEEAKTCTFDRLAEEWLGDYAPDELSGYRRLDLRRLFNAILFFCRDGQLKTKLNKLLFYLDFKHFKENTISVTGARYIHLQYGPVPDNFDYFFAELERRGALEMIEEAHGEYTGFKCIARSAPDLTVFDESELAVLNLIVDHFRDYGSKAIMELSHTETAYRSTRDRETISYGYAESLSI